jgi:hypothetical protein
MVAGRTHSDHLAVGTCYRSWLARTLLLNGQPSRWTSWLAALHVARWWCVYVLAIDVQ